MLGDGPERDGPSVAPGRTVGFFGPSPPRDGPRVHSRRRTGLPRLPTESRAARAGPSARVWGAIARLRPPGLSHAPGTGGREVHSFCPPARGGGMTDRALVVTTFAGP